MTVLDLAFFLSTEDGFFGPQTDPNASIGGQISATQPFDNQGDITAPLGDLLNFTDDQFTGESNVIGSWIILLTGANDNFATKVVGYDSGAGTFTVFPPLPVVAALTDTYRLYRSNGLFNATDPALSSSRLNRHRLIFYRIDGTQWSNISCFVVDHDPGPLALEIASSDFEMTNEDIPNIIIETNDPDTTTSSVFADFSNQPFMRPPDGTFGLVPTETTASLANNNQRAMWLRLGFREDVPPRPQSQCAFQVIVQSESTPADRASFMVVVDVDGPDLTRTLGPDRALRIAGGARIQAEVKETLTGDPVPGYTAVFKLDSPSPGSLGPPNQDVTTDDGVITEAVYTSPTDLGEVGTIVNFTVEVH